MGGYSPYYRAQKWFMKRRGIHYRDIAAVLNYSELYVRKLLSHPEKPWRVQQLEQAIAEVIKQRGG